jgi:phage terminase large subunit GpA-like protein
MREFSDNDNKEIVVVAPVGSGKTTFFEGAVPYIISEEPGPCLIALQTDAEASTWSETRLMPSLMLCDPIKNLFPEDRHKKRKTEIIFPHMPLLIGGANLSTLQSKSMRYVIGDEVWLWKQGMIEEARRRTHDRWNSRVLLVSQGSFEGDDFHEAYKQTDQRVFKWLCECGERNPWNFEYIIYNEVRDSSERLMESEIENSARLRCPHCEKEYEDKIETRRSLSDGSIYESSNNVARAGYVGFTYEATCVWWISWGKLAVEWAKANESKKQGVLKPLAQFVQKRRAKFWADQITDNRAALIAADYKKSDFVDGSKMKGELHRIMTVDVQRDHFWAIIRAWRADGTSQLIYESKILTWESVREIQLQYKVQDRFVAIDAQYITDQVYLRCSQWDWNAIHGSGKDYFAHISGKRKIKKLYSPFNNALASNGKKARYLHWSNEKVKDILAFLRAGSGSAWDIPQDISDAYLNQIDSEVKKDFVNNQDKSVKQRWVKIKKDNHFWDCEAMNLMFAVMLNIIPIPEVIED